MAEERVSSETAFQGKLLTVRVDTVRTASGRETIREVVEYPGAVAILPVLDDGRVVLVRQFRYATGRSLLEVPAGTREPGEAPEVTAARELREEVGYKADSLELMFRYFISPGWCSGELVAYRASGLRDVGAQPEQDEDLELVTVSLFDVPALIASGEIADGKTISTLFAQMRGN